MNAAKPNPIENILHQGKYLRIYGNVSKKSEVDYLASIINSSILRNKKPFLSGLLQEVNVNEDGTFEMLFVLDGDPIDAITGEVDYSAIPEMIISATNLHFLLKEIKING